ncbi:Cytochrome P450 [Mycena kentingensis (nom. inval.)]|nr:Cytochrome P450 [Mycena kentingensis (nom. inval.)]
MSVLPLPNSKLLVALIGAGVPAAYALYRILSGKSRSALRFLPGPPRTSGPWLLGDVPALVKEEDTAMFERWVATYGPTLRCHGLFGSFVLYTMDDKALQHVLSHPEVYEKGPGVRKMLTRVVGPGLLVVEGQQHRQQRKIMNPAFGPAHIRVLTPIFLGKAAELRDIWLSQVDASGCARVDALNWLSKCTLDIISLAGFNYPLNSLASSGEDENELASAFETIFTAESDTSGSSLVRDILPMLRLYKTATDRKVARAQATMLRVGKELMEESKRECESVGGRKDLLSLLIRANTAKEVPESQRMADEDVIAQIPTFLVAGHETSSTAVSWALFELAQHPEMQTRLRAELLAVPVDEPSAETLNSLKYLDFVVRETLRLHSPVRSTSRVAMRDDVVPLAEPFTDATGKRHDSLIITKGEYVFIPILTMNRAERLWGEDAKRFMPDRWEHTPVATAGIPGVWDHSLTFLGGPRGCIGYRFALDEIKAILFTLVRAFVFELGVPASDIGEKSTPIVKRPIVLSEMEKGTQLPLVVRPVSV